MRIVGIIAIVASCLAIGRMRVKSFKEEMRILDALSKGIQVMRAELSCRLCPMEELLSMAAGQAGTEAASFFHTCADGLSALSEKSFAQVWTEACRKKLSMLSEENFSQLAALGASLGRYELDEQLAACDRYLLCTEDKLKSMREKLPEMQRLSLALSAAAGVFLCLLIL